MTFLKKNCLLIPVEIAFRTQLTIQSFHCYWEQHYFKGLWKGLWAILLDLISQYYLGAVTVPPHPEELCACASDNNVGNIRSFFFCFYIPQSSKCFSTFLHCGSLHITPYPIQQPWLVEEACWPSEDRKYRLRLSPPGYTPCIQAKKQIIIGSNSSKPHLSTHYIPWVSARCLLAVTTGDYSIDTLPRTNPATKKPHPFYALFFFLHFYAFVIIPKQDTC